MKIQQDFWKYENYLSNSIELLRSKLVERKHHLALTTSANIQQTVVSSANILVPRLVQRSASQNVRRSAFTVKEPQITLYTPYFTVLLQFTRWKGYDTTSPFPCQIHNSHRKVKCETCISCEIWFPLIFVI